MSILTLTTDSQGRLVLPSSYANTTVRVEELSDTELLIRRESAKPTGDEPAFLEDRSRPLSDRDRELFLAMLDNPPAPNDALKNLLANRGA